MSEVFCKTSCQSAKLAPTAVVDSIPSLKNRALPSRRKDTTMRSHEAFEVKLSTSQMCCLALWLWICMVGAVQAQPQQSDLQSGSDPIEEVEVTGQASRLALRVEIVAAETRMFDLFNQLNDMRQFNISCEAVMVTGSRIAERECVPAYMKRARMTSAQNFLLFDLTPHIPGSKMGGGKSLGTKGAPEAQQQLWFRNNHKHEAFNANFRELAAQHPQLASAALDLQAKRARLEELEASQRKEGTLGRIFGGFGGKTGD
jgi:hypothetical protein